MTRHVFIIEDNELLVRMYRSMFESIGCSVTHAATVRDALHLSRGMKTDLIILDDRLADGSGIAATAQLRGHLENSNAPIIATLSQLGGHDDEALREGGYASIVTKPFQVSAFSALAERFVGKDAGLPAVMQ